MEPSDDLQITRGWLRDATDLFVRTVAGLSDAALGEPSLLPGWSRKHVLAHVHHNALAVGRLVRWAATGVEQAMYPEPERRMAAIEEESLLPAADLRARVVESAHALAEGFDGLGAQQWVFPVRTVVGKQVPASALPYLRTREIAVHCVDLGAGAGFDDLPPGFVARVLGDVVADRSAQGYGPGLAAWLTGRTSAAPTLGPWI